MSRFLFASMVLHEPAFRSGAGRLRDAYARIDTLAGIVRLPAA
jgi:hypothetical protein